MQCRFIYPPYLLPLVRSRILTDWDELDQRVNDEESDVQKLN